MEDKNFQIAKRIIEKDITPQYIYKFTTANKYLLSNLLHSQLWFASPLSFNDPFDCSFYIKSGFNEKDIEDIVSNFVILGLFQSGEEKIYIPKLKEIFNKKPEAFDQIINEHIHKIFTTLGITCFCDNKENTLLWAHYADSNKGVCLKFDVLKDHKFFFSGDQSIPTVAISRMKYVSNYFDFLTFKNIRKDILKVIPFTKSDEWKYEREIRLVSKEIGPQTFNKSALIEITFGCNCNDTDKKDIIKIVKNTDYPNLAFQQANKSKTQFGFDFEDIIINNLK